MLEIFRTFLTEFVHYLQFILEAISVICVVIGFLKTLYVMIIKVDGGEKARLTFGNWLATALEFQLGADILITTIDPDTESLVKLAVIAIIRTFLNYFLSKELEAEKLDKDEKESKEIK